MSMATSPPPRGQRSLLRSAIYWGLVIAVWAGIAIAVFFAVFSFGLPNVSNLDQVRRQPSITYLDRSGAVIAVHGEDRAPPVDLDSLPAFVPAAFVAIEDKQFYHHLGFNPWGMLRSEIWDVAHPHGPLRGGSTITQQLARNLFLTPAQTYRRKAQELVLAVELERHYSKKQILALYLNRVNFGGGAYGIEAASQRYFNKPARQLTLGEAALLAAAMKGPSRYNPAANSERAAKRATLVLDEMVKTGAITREQRDAAFAQPVHVSAHLADQHGAYFVDWLDSQVRARAGDVNQDLVVETTLDLPIQSAGEEALISGVAAHAREGVQEGALVAMDGQGRIRAYVGGVDYAESQYDRATAARRQAGSSFKPFVYLTAMEAGHTPQETAVDEPVTIRGWTPRDYTGRYLGTITLQTALAQSINTVAARLAEQVGQPQVAATAHRLGINSPIQTGPSMALGAVEVSPMEMVDAYDSFANGGLKVQPYGIERIRTSDGRVLYDHGADGGAQQTVIGEPALAYMNQMLRQVIAAGTGTGARVPGYDIAGKTGTTSDYRDAWFLGYTGGFTAGVWIGRDDNRPMRKITGGSAPAQIWRAFMSRALPRLAAQAIPGAPPPEPTSAPPEPGAGETPDAPPPAAPDAVDETYGPAPPPERPSPYLRTPPPPAPRPYTRPPASDDTDDMDDDRPPPRRYYAPPPPPPYG
ncbi:MAG TPA: PBP1A family penicillin-binding protein [Caulobacteraceae bacterium]|jgi:penicillin-binding protein 1A|nr:PBP1A family penicillin-binding protein [Caulobacteraceae bacterium]